MACAAWFGPSPTSGIGIWRAARRRQIPTAVVAAQARDRQWRDVDAPEGLRRCSNRVHDGRPNDRGVRDHNRPPFVSFFASEPVGDPLHHAQDRFAAMRRCLRSAQPGGDGLRFARANVLEATPAPGPVVAIPQHGFDGRVESKDLRSLPCPQFRTGKPPVGVRQTPGQCRGAGLAVLVEGFVGREGSATYGGGRGVTDQNEARRHRKSSARHVARYSLRRATSTRRTANRASPT